MSYVSFLKNIPFVLTQPTGIAALASLGIHSAIAFILPLVPVDSSKSAKQTPTDLKPLGLTQLTPAEQSRLPQIPIPQSGSLQAQLPPLPGQIPSLPTQQQLPLNLPNMQSGLPPAPPPGAIMPLTPGSSALSLPPSLQTPNFNVSSLPRNSSLRLNRRDLVIDPNFGLNPTASVNISRFPRSSRINNNVALGSRSYSSASSPRSFVPSNLPEPPVTQPSNFPVAPPPLPPEATTSTTTTTTDSGVAAQQTPQPENQAVVTPNQYIAPVDNAPKPTEGNYTVAAQPVTPFQPQVGGINEIAAGTPSSGSTVPGTAANTPGINAPTVTGEARKTISMLDAFTEAKRQYPEVEFSGAPIRISIPKSQLDRNVEVAVRMDRENKIDSVQLLEDGISIPSNNKLAVRERLLQYFKENPAALNGKGKLFTFRISPDGTVSSENPTENKPSDRTLPTPTQNITNENNQPAPVAPQGSNPTIKPFSGLQLNRNKPVTVPQVNTPTETNAPRPGSTVPTSIDKPSNEASPVGGNRTTPPKLPNFKPKETSSPLDRVEPAPLVPVKPSSQTQSTPTPQVTAKPLVDKLRENQTQSASEGNSEQPSVVQKLRQFKQEQDSN